ncbi:anaerobic ribonucleoside-triphosphate reductase activating protein [Pontiella agarivorans]|uniref:Anaerobic ribonucleoside-triphosphate reductase activating protein n=1 Tax=Pontiella agarivorans TaxID=3038953 RepID=A0ABU5MVE0_9BACT|nr:anaerobic ribonucleoside-triphosphate reductase activating protein [Pontiella agarivorans]MDZ8118097.1 anaerobic ribonucleoside-triphosphate reductase activating protein [Pontiella agarivorans]
MTSSVYAYLEKPSMVDFPGKFSAVFFTSGCNFRCGFCHNASLMGRKRSGIDQEALELACTKFKHNWVNGAVITGGEPTLADDLPQLIELMKKYGFAVKLDTNGSNPGKLREVLPLVDYVAMDVKTGLSGYRKLVHFPDLGKISESIELIKAEAKDYEFRTTVIESLHTDALMDEVADVIAGSKRMALQAFIPRDNLPDKKFTVLPRTPSSRLQELKDRMAGCADEILLRGA